MAQLERQNLRSRDELEQVELRHKKAQIKVQHEVKQLNQEILHLK